MSNKDTLKTNNVRLSAIKAKLESLPEQKTVSPDFSEGNVIVEPSEGKLLTSVTIEKPSTLLSKNILEGVTIAGVVGSAFKIATGTFMVDYKLMQAKGYEASGPLSISGLGFKPKYLFVHILSTPFDTGRSRIVYFVLGEAGLSNCTWSIRDSHVYSSSDTSETMFHTLTIDDDGFTVDAVVNSWTTDPEGIGIHGKFEYIAIG